MEMSDLEVDNMQNNLKLMTIRQENENVPFTTQILFPIILSWELLR